MRDPCRGEIGVGKKGQHPPALQARVRVYHHPSSTASTVVRPAPSAIGRAEPRTQPQTSRSLTRRRAPSRRASECRAPTGIDAKALPQSTSRLALSRSSPASHRHRVGSQQAAPASAAAHPAPRLCDEATRRTVRDRGASHGRRGRVGSRFRGHSAPRPRDCRSKARGFA